MRAYVCGQGSRTEEAAGGLQMNPNCSCSWDGGERCDSWLLNENDNDWDFVPGEG